MTDLQNKQITFGGKILLTLTGGVAIGLTIITGSFVSPALRKYCLPYIPATNRQIVNVIKAINTNNGRVLDLGSGDGRIVLELGKRGFDANGIELNPWLVIYSKIDAWRQNLHKKIHIQRGNLWKCQLNSYDYIVIFGVEQMMNDLGKKFLIECKNNCKIIACRFPLPNFKPKKIIGSGLDTVWLYEINKSN